MGSSLNQGPLLRVPERLRTGFYRGFYTGTRKGSSLS